MKTHALTLCMAYLYWALKIEHLRLYFSPKHCRGSFGSTCGFIKFFGLETIISAVCHVSKLFMNKQLSLVFCFLMGICCSTFVHVCEQNQVDKNIHLISTRSEG